MNYIKATTKYVFKSSKLLFPLALIPAVILGVFVTPMSSITFISDYSSAYVYSVSDIINLTLNMNTIKHVYPLILIFLSLLFSACLMLSVIERHFRTGRLNLKKPLTGINETFFPVVKVLVICAVLMVLYTVIYISIVSLIHFTISGSRKPVLADIIISAVAVIVIFILFMSLTGPAVFMLPLMIINGYAFTDAVTFAFALVGKKPVKIIFGGIFPFLIAAAIQYMLSFLKINNSADKYIGIVAASIIYMFLIAYMLSYVMVVMFDISGLARKDIKAHPYSA